MELLIMAYALKTSCAKNIIGVLPYFPYSKQCTMRNRGSIVCKLLASMLAKAGTSVNCDGHMNAAVSAVSVLDLYKERPGDGEERNATDLRLIFTRRTSQ